MKQNRAFMIDHVETGGLIFASRGGFFLSFVASVVGVMECDARWRYNFMTTCNASNVQKTPPHHAV